ncbi:MAG: ketopantoate reductase family protein [Rhodospirillaceae bacterium]|jgi:2-dehydropantoate 2-reductase|nr:ketopantoate reductase family protein [Rhodospirillaceae bacterium]MBT3931633.1 ketopantoate reductase family protein [Rhodospirillaceae bacterium]MBT4773653.1 ketopantoate reductase family protein [Rhodospirillaceae bacterium]MBT5358882.1 ketopantoate reductase family protein [Rhodospirillaceae bacterium]MBT5770173.1 ketopantoate reductase family protein [Rhodospirillaceae bacterium]
MKFLILGAGAIGGYVGGRLTEAGRDVTFLVRDARREQLERDGLRLESTYGDFAGPVKTISQAELTPDYDLILLTCKAYDLDDALDAIAPGVGPDTMVFPILNGLGHIAIMNDRLGAEHVLAGTVKISAARQADGTIKHMNDWRWLNFGEQAGGISDRISALRDALDGATGLEPVALENAMQEMWEKMVHLATAAGMTTLMRANVGQIVRTQEGASLFQHFLETTAEVAKRSGHPPSDAFMKNYRALFSDPQSKYVTSMLRDIEAGNRSEGEHILGMLLATAREVGIDEPLLATAYAGVKAYEARQNDGGL